MDIETIKRKRQKSVQEQNAILKHTILACAKKWLDNEVPLPRPIEACLHQIGLNRQTALLVEYFDGPAQFQMSYSGLLITNEETFFAFEFELNVNETCIEHIEQFEMVEIECSGHLKGTGQSFGFLSKEVLHEVRC